LCILRVMETRRILIAGDTLFTETLAQLLANDPSVELVGVAPDLETARQILDAHCPDALIYTGQPGEMETPLARLLSSYPDLPVLCTDLSANAIQVIVSRRISVHSSNDLMDAITALPKRT